MIIDSYQLPDRTTVLELHMLDEDNYMTVFPDGNVEYWKDPAFWRDDIEWRYSQN
jgi:hypothetical protein